MASACYHIAILLVGILRVFSLAVKPAPITMSAYTITVEIPLKVFV